MKNRRQFLQDSALFGLAFSAFALANPLFANYTKTFTMPKRKLGNLEVSALGFGLMGLNYHRSIKLSETQAQKIVDKAVELGINFFDTAQVYGPDSNEILAGKILKKYKDKIIIATKFGFGKDISVLDSSPKRIKEVCEQSLKRLNLETIPLFYQHRSDPNTPIEEVASVIKDLMKEGKVQNFGVCELNAQSIKEAHKICPITAVQSEYHLMWRDVEREILPTLESLNIGFVAYSPLNRGYLSGKLNKNTEFDPSNDNRTILPRFTKEALEANYKIIDTINIFRKEELNNKATPAQIALAYLLAKKPYIVPLFGTSKLEHLSENVETLTFSLSKTQVESLESRLEKIEIMGTRYPKSEQDRVGK